MDELIARLRAVSETGCDPDLPHEAADAIVALAQRAEDAEQLATARGHTINGLRNELQAARLERDDIEVVLELERMRLAACGVVALSDTPESAAKSRAMNDEYRSASCDDVARRVDECMALRAERDSLVAKLKELEGQEPVAWRHFARKKHALHRLSESPKLDDSERSSGWVSTPLFARPVPAEPSRLVTAVRGMIAAEQECKSPSAWVQKRLTPEQQAMKYLAWKDLHAALAAAESQQAEPVRLTDDSQRLDWIEQKARESRTGVSFDFVRYSEEGCVIESGYRVMWRNHLGQRFRTLLEAIDDAMSNHTNGYKVEV